MTLSMTTLGKIILIITILSIRALRIMKFEVLKLDMMFISILR